MSLYLQDLSLVLAFHTTRFPLISPCAFAEGLRVEPRVRLLGLVVVLCDAIRRGSPFLSVPFPFEPASCVFV